MGIVTMNMSSYEIESSDSIAGEFICESRSPALVLQQQTVSLYTMPLNMVGVDAELFLDIMNARPTLAAGK